MSKNYSITIFCAVLLMAAPGFAFFPVPVERSEAEVQIEVDLAQAETALDSVIIAKRYLRNHPDDIPLGRAAQQVLVNQLDDKVGFFMSRHEDMKTLASFYLYARATDFALADETVLAIVDANRDNFWAWLMWMATEWHKDAPDMAVVIDRAETAVTLDGSRPEGYLFLSLAYLEQDRLHDSQDALEAGLTCDPLDERFREMLLDIYLKQRDADAFFQLMSGTVPQQPIEVDLATINHKKHITTDDLRGQVSVLVYWAMGSDICINHELQEMNHAAIEADVSWPIYALHLGEQDVSEYITERDQEGNEWKLQFLEGSSELEQQLDSPQRPCVYVLGPNGYVHGLVNGRDHSEDLIETVIWLAEQVARRM